MQRLTGRAFDQRADVRGNVAMTAGPALLPNWRLEPNLTGAGEFGDVKPVDRRRQAQRVARYQAAARSPVADQGRGVAGAQCATIR